MDVGFSQSKDVLILNFIAEDPEAVVRFEMARVYTYSIGTLFLIVILITPNAIDVLACYPDDSFLFLN